MFLNAKKLNYLLIGLIIVAVMALMGSAYAATILLKQKSKDISKAKLQSLALEEKQRLLRKARSDIETYRQLAEIAQTIVPQDKDQAPTVREINNLAVASGLTLGTITFPDSSLGSTDGKDAQLKDVPGIEGVQALTITIKTDRDVPTRFANLLRYLEALEQNRRTALVRSVTIEPDEARAGMIQVTLTIDEYIRK
jgi:type II secretory pathway pseudopilin PulG